MKQIPKSYLIGSWVTDHACRAFGSHFHAAHMVWGTINEVTAVQAYRKLGELSGHPVLKQLVMGIVQEESIHSSFYWNIARLKLSEKKFARDLARFIIARFWTPVGQGAKREHETNYVLTTLFKGANGIKDFHRAVTGRIERLPGFHGFNGLTERIASGMHAEKVGVLLFTLMLGM
jgi:hypothetical protein